MCYYSVYAYLQLTVQWKLQITSVQGGNTLLLEAEKIC